MVKMSKNASKASRYPRRGVNKANPGVYANQDGDDPVEDEDEEVPVESDDPSSSDELGKDEENKTPRYPRRGANKANAGVYTNEDGDEEEEVPVESDDPASSDELGEDEEEFERLKSSRRYRHPRRHRVRHPVGKKDQAEKDDPGRRKSARSNKFQKSMKEPRGIADFFVPLPSDDESSQKKQSHKGSSISSSKSLSESGEAEDEKNVKSLRRKSRRGSVAELDGPTGKTSNGNEAEVPALMVKGLKRNAVERHTGSGEDADEEHEGSTKVSKKPRRNSSDDIKQEVRAKVPEKPRRHSSVETEQLASRIPRKSTRKPVIEEDSSSDAEEDQISNGRRKKRSKESVSTEDECSSGDDSGSDDDDPVKIHRILGSKSEKIKVWNEICSKMNTSEIDSGSLWHQKEEKANVDEDAFEERFLVKWTDMSYLHCSWETAKDLEEQTDNSKTYLGTFFRKSKDGVLFTPEERCDGDYFDPAFVQIDRIMDVDWRGMDEWTAEDEDKATLESLGIITDKESLGYEEGLGREFYIKWGNTPYDDSTFEYERDLILNGIDYKEQLKAFLKRKTKPSAQAMKGQIKAADSARRKLYKIFGEKSSMSEESRNAAMEEYQKSLREKNFKNGGQLRDYQAEGVSWMVANYLNKRSCILADEMGLGKTLQTAATVNAIKTQLQPNSRCLIIAPLSTIPHWLREFQSWTDLNAVVYHGSAEDRRKIREWEMVYEECRANSGVSGYLRRCMKKCTKQDSPWMVQVVIATPEMLITEDAFELSAIHWEVLVVDEAHRLKNHNSKLAATLRDSRFIFNYRILCTGTPIQNDMKELWTLLNFIDVDSFGSMTDFLEKYGEMKSKETVDQLHETLRPYILRRLKEDVEKSMPPKEETIIEVELTLPQKQYYRALYEKNVKFLHKGKIKSMDGPSLTNLAMQLRKCCNHVCLLNGIEDELRKHHSEISDPDFLTKGSGKLVLLDKLLPRLKEEGHRVLIFSQFKIVLDILEDYLDGRRMTFGRIDGSITGLRRQAAIDAFQSKKENAPFIMMLSTRAGGVGINLTAADTVIIFDSDWNPQNDLQAQARCHRIGQERAVKVYRLLSARTYEMHMFDLSSKKMALDQVVLKGFENNAEASLSKAEVENLLRHGAYAIMAEEKEGKSEITTNEFVEQDIDTILARRTRTIVHDGGSSGDNSGGTFSKASFKLSKPVGQSDGNGEIEDVDIDDPDFWKKMLGAKYTEDDQEDLHPKRRRCKKDYTEADKGEDGDKDPDASDLDYSYKSEETSHDGSSDSERSEWGGAKLTEWKREQVEKLERLLYSYGYGNLSWTTAIKFLDISKSEEEVRRMSWSLLFGAFLEAAQKDAIMLKKKAEKAAEKQEIAEASKVDSSIGGVLASTASANSSSRIPSKAELAETAFQKLWVASSTWTRKVIDDAVCYAKGATPRDHSIAAKALSPDIALADENTIREEFGRNVWKSLQHRGWKATLITDGPLSGKSVFSFKDESFRSIDQIVKRARIEHPELAQALDNIIELLDAQNQRSAESKTKMRESHLKMTQETVTLDVLQAFLKCYAPIQLLADKTTGRTVSLCSRRLLFSIPVVTSIFSFIRSARLSDFKDPSTINRLASLLMKKPRSAKTLPHPDWTCYHDAVLLSAVYRHGYIELDENYRGVLADKIIKWGPPFDSIPILSPLQSATNDACLEVITRVAKRAEKVVNSLNAEEAKNINKTSLGEHFCLAPVGRLPGGDSALLAGAEPCSLNSEGLLRKYRLHFETKLVPLPQKKELVKRASFLSTCLLDSSAEEGVEAPEELKDASFGFAVLDQKEPANGLLVELIRALLKGQASTKENKDFTKSLCVLVLEEARERSREIRQFLEQTKATPDATKEACDRAEMIVKHIQLVESSLLQPRLFKNVLRVLLGEQPVPSKSPGEPLFPPEPRPDLLIESSGRRAIEGARKKHSIKSSTSLTEGAGLFLTETETLIFSTACSRGIPTWSPHWRPLKVCDKPIGYHSINWGDFSKHTKTMAKLARERARKVYDEALEYSKEKTESEQHANEELLLSAKQAVNNLTQAHDQLEEYEGDPLLLAKKTILVLAKMLKKATSAKSDHGLGHRIPKWFNGQVLSWAGSLGLVGRDGVPLALSAVDFLEDVSQEQQCSIDVVACLDKQQCREVLDQIASVSRLRTLFVCTDADVILTQIKGALDMITRMEGSVPLLHVAWKLGVDDILLLRRLLNVGYHALPGSVQSFGIQSVAAKTSFRKLLLSEGVLQSRVNHLVRGLDEYIEVSLSTGTQSSDVKVVGVRWQSESCETSNCVQDIKRKQPEDAPFLPMDGSSSEKKIRFV